MQKEKKNDLSTIQQRTPIDKGEIQILRPKVSYLRLWLLAKIWNITCSYANRKARSTGNLDGKSIDWLIDLDKSVGNMDE